METPTVFSILANLDDWINKKEQMMEKVFNVPSVAIANRDNIDFTAAQKLLEINIKELKMVREMLLQVKKGEGTL